MKQQRLVIRVDEGSISVKHRVPLLRILAMMLLTLYAYTISIGGWRFIVNFHNSHNLFAGFFRLLLLLIPLLWSAVMWFSASSGEVLRCDATALHFARRRTFGRWQRHHFQSARIQGLRRAFRKTNRRRHVTVLTFQYDGRTFDVLEDIPLADSDRILQACKTLGLDTIIPIDAGAAMQRDIAQRGWWINPWRSDRDPVRPAKQ